MNRRRTSSGFGPNPITNSEMQAWAELRGITLTNFEIYALDEIESLYFFLRPKK